jgi:hypothetical protein
MPRFVRGTFSYRVNKDSDANASRERILTPSLPDLIRQSIRQRREHFSKRRILNFSMDHRVKPGGDDLGG